MSKKLAVVCGAGGFIGGHLVRKLIGDGHQVRAVDIRPFNEWEQHQADSDNHRLDLRKLNDCYQAVGGAEVIYNLAADMGGIGFIENNKAACMLNVLINTNLLIASREAGVGRFFFSSSACIYPLFRQGSANVLALKESNAYPADCEDGYGWEKLFSERMCRAFRQDFKIAAVCARFHNVYGPCGTYCGGREKAPAAICRKVVEAKLADRHEIEIWGDGEQTRSFMYIDDCIDGVGRLMAADINQPINLGSNELVTINRLVDIVEDIAGTKVRRTYNQLAPTGVRGRNSDNTLIKQLLGWEPSISLQSGLEPTYRWIYDQLKKNASTK